MIRVLGLPELRTRARDKALVLTFLATGLRLNELRELRLAEVHIKRPIEESYLFVRAETSNGRESRQVRLDRTEKGDAAALFLTEEGKTFAHPGFTNYMARIGSRFEAAGIANWMAHRGRHYWATSAHRAGTSVFDMSRRKAAGRISRWSSGTGSRVDAQLTPTLTLDTVLSPQTSELVSKSNQSSFPKIRRASVRCGKVKS